VTTTYIVTPKDIESLIADTLETVLTDWLINEVSTHDQSRANWVIIGKPTKELRDPITISIHTQHPLGPDKDTDKLVEGRPRSAQERPLQFFRETSGGARQEMMFGAIQVRIRENLPPKTALNLKGAVVDRIKKAINRDTRLKTLTDDLGNTMFWIETFKHSGHASGGSDVSIFIEWIDWRAAVCSDNRRNVTI
jgi:hypothetical protein